MPPLFGSEIAQELPDRGIPRSPRSPGIEALRLRFHELGLLTHLVQSERLTQPYRLALHESAHILPADQRNAVAEFAPEQVQQAMSVAAFLIGHGAEHAPGIRIRFSK